MRELLLFAIFLVAGRVFSALEGLPADTTATMWALAGLLFVIAIIGAVLLLIFRDAMEDDANWLHGAGALLLWLLLALCVEGSQALAESLPSRGEVGRRVFVDAWISIGIRTVIYFTTPFLVLLGLTVGRTLWGHRQDRKAQERSRVLRGTLPRVSGKGRAR